MASFFSFPESLLNIQRSIFLLLYYEMILFKNYPTSLRYNWQTLYPFRLFNVVMWYIYIYTYRMIMPIKLINIDIISYNSVVCACVCVLRTLKIPQFSSGQFSSVAQSCPTLWDPMNRSTPGLPVHHHLPESTQTHVHRVCDAIQPSHPRLSPSPPAPNPSQHHNLFQWVNSSHEVAKVLEFQL